MNVKVTVANPQRVDRNGKTASKTVTIPEAKLEQVQLEATRRGQEVKRVSWNS